MFRRILAAGLLFASLPAAADTTIKGPFAAGSGIGVSGNQITGPTVNVMSKRFAGGAVGNGSTDDAAAFQAAIDELAGGRGGTVYVPARNFCIKTKLLVSTDGISIQGDPGPSGSYMNSCGADVSILELAGNRDQLNDILLTGSRTLNTTHPAVIVSGVEDQLWRNRIDGGSNAIKITGPDSIVISNRLVNSYGNALVYIGTGGACCAASYLIRNKIDQGAVGTVPNLASISSTPAWAALTSYATSTGPSPVIVNTSGYLLQAIVGGTSGSSAPTVPLYGNTVVDGTVTWQMLSPSTYYGVLADSGAVAVYLAYNDLTGPYKAGYASLDTFSGFAPQTHILHGNIFGLNRDASILMSAGAGLMATDNQVADCLVANCNGIILNAAWAGDATISDNLVYGNPVGIDVAAGTNTTISNNNTYGASGACIKVEAGVTKFTITGGNAGASATWNACQIGVQIVSGASDHYYIGGVNVTGASTPISDAGTGADKFIGNNPGDTMTNTITSGFKVATGTLTKTTNTTVATVPGLAVPLLAGHRYNCRGHLTGTSGASGGVKVALNATGGLTATASSFTGFTWNGTTAVSNTTASLGANIAASDAIYTDVYIDGAIQVNDAGSIELQGAQNTSDATSTTFLANSTFSCARVD